MKIAIPSTGQGLEAQANSQFGRTPYFVLVEIKNGEIKNHETMKNQAAGARHGAGIQASQSIANRGAEVAIASNIGPKAFNALSSAGLKIFTGASGTVESVVQDYLEGNLKEISEATTSKGQGKRGGRRR